MGDTHTSSSRQLGLAAIAGAGHLCKRKVFCAIHHLSFSSLPIITDSCWTALTYNLHQNNTTSRRGSTFSSKPRTGLGHRCTMKPIVLSTLTLVPVALGLNPAGRWGHQAVYVPSQAAMYVVGGQVSTTNFQITNDVLVFPVCQSQHLRDKLIRI
jgi:hypothetical protein